MSTDAVYVRLSQPKKGEAVATADSLNGQLETIQEKFGPLDGVRVYSDVISAYAVRSAARPDWAELEADIRAGKVKRVVARHVDRLYRHLTDLGSLVKLVEETGVKIDTAWSGELDLNTASGRTTARIMASIAQGEVETLKERVNAKLAANRAAGRAPGGSRPFGWESANGALVPTEAARVKQAMADVLAGVTVTAIAKRWAADGVPTATGGQWRTQTVKVILRRWRNAGHLTHDDQDAGPAKDIDAIVSLETVQAVRAMLDDPKRTTTTPGRGPKPRNLCTGLAVCACGGTMTGRTRPTGRPGEREAVYCCSAKGCANAIAREILDAEAVRAMGFFYANTNPSDFAPTDADRAEYQALQVQSGELDGERKSTVALMKKGLLSASEAEEVLQGVQERQEALEADLARLQRSFALASSLAAPFDGKHVDISAVAELRKRFKKQPLDLQRRQLAQVWKVTVHGRFHAAGLGLSKEDRQLARLELKNLVQENLSYNMLDELTNSDN